MLKDEMRDSKHAVQVIESNNSAIHKKSLYYNCRTKIERTIQLSQILYKISFPEFIQKNKKTLFYRERRNFKPRQMVYDITEQNEK